MPLPLRATVPRTHMLLRSSSESPGSKLAQHGPSDSDQLACHRPRPPPVGAPGPAGGVRPLPAGPGIGPTRRRRSLAATSHKGCVPARAPSLSRAEATTRLIRRSPPPPSRDGSGGRGKRGQAVPQRGRVGPHDAISDASPFPAWGPARPPNRRGIRTAHRLACSDLIIVFYDDLIIVSPCGQNISISDDSVYFRHDLGLYSVRNRDQSGITSTSPDPCWLAMQKTPKNECISLRRLNRRMRSPS